MNSEQAKKLSLPEIMARMGYQPTKVVKNGNEYWYLSPFRKEAEPSFHTSFLGGKWIWNDFGDIGGTVIDFVMRHENHTKVHEALAFLDRMYSRKSYSFRKKTSDLFSPIGMHSHFQKQPSQNQAAEPAFRLEKVVPLNKTLLYLRDTRKLDAEIVAIYLEEIYFQNIENGKNYFAAGIKNRAGGYEIRNPYFKSCIGKKDITFIESSKPGTSVMIFEGFIDFLSFLTDKKMSEPEQDVFILNSVSFGERALSLIRESAYSKVLTFFDNDRAGETLLDTFKEELGLEKIQPMNFLYKDFRDYNEKLARVR